MAASAYRLRDEPRTPLAAHLAAEPIWILLACMLGGTWLGWPWFVFNALAVGSPTRVREIVLVVLGFVGSAGISLGLLLAFGTGGPYADAGATVVRLAALGLLAWKLVISYAVTMVQSRTIAIHRYYGGVLRNGLLLALVGMMLRGRVLTPLPTFWVLVLQ